MWSGLAGINPKIPKYTNCILPWKLALNLFQGAEVSRWLLDDVSFVQSVVNADVLPMRGEAETETGLMTTRYWARSPHLDTAHGMALGHNNNSYTRMARR